MCFAFLLLPILVAMDLPAVLSVWMLVITVVLLNVSCRKFLMCRAFVAPVPRAYSSDSADDSATTACVLEPKCTVVPATCITKPVVDLGCSWASCPVGVGVDVDLYLAAIWNGCWPHDVFQAFASL